MIVIVTPVRRAAISDPNRTGRSTRAIANGAAGQREAGQRDQREDRAPGQIESREEVDVALHRRVRR